MNAHIEKDSKTDSAQQCEKHCANDIGSQGIPIDERTAKKDEKIHYGNHLGEKMHESLVHISCGHVMREVVFEQLGNVNG